MNKVRLVVVAMLTAAMAFTIVTPANAAGGGKYSRVYDSSITKVYFSGPTPDSPQVVKGIAPGGNAAGFSKVLFVQAPRGYDLGIYCYDGTYPRGYSWRNSTSGEWQRACPDNIRMEVTVWRAP